MKEVYEKIKEKWMLFINEGKEDLKKIKSPKDLAKQIPNLFTISRLFLAPFIVANILSGNLITAGYIALAASVTDLIDGKVARALDASSNFGANLDAVVDKIFITSVTIPLFITNPYLIVPIILDMTIASVNGYAHIKGLQPRTSKIGKVKTVFLDSLICSAFFIDIRNFDKLFKILYLSTVILQVRTLNDYCKTYEASDKKINRDIKNNDLEVNEIEEQTKVKTLSKTLESNSSVTNSKKEELESLKKIIKDYKENDVNLIDNELKHIKK
ncbi:MAG: CDP-alcohol phosphatidyltransferase family protein [Bacilli bacterium]